MSFNLNSRVKIQNKTPNLDYYYGVYNSVAEAIAGVPLGAREPGRTVGIWENGKVVEYWWESDDSDNGLVVKNAQTPSLQDLADIDPGGIDLRLPSSTYELFQLYSDTSHLRIGRYEQTQPHIRFDANFTKLHAGANGGFGSNNQILASKTGQNIGWTNIEDIPNLNLPVSATSDNSYLRFYNLENTLLFETSLPSGGGSGVTDHSQLSGLQGGTAGEYYHLTLQQLEDLATTIKSGDNISELTNDSGYITGYTVTQTDVESALPYTIAQVEDQITDGVTDIAPSQNAVFDALQGKEDSLAYTPEDSANKASDFTALDNTKFPTTLAVDTHINSKGYITGYSVTEEDVTQHQAALQLTESQISDLQHVTATSQITNDSGFITSADLSASDNYQNWKLWTNGVQRTSINSLEKLDLQEGANISISYSAGGVVTISGENGGGIQEINGFTGDSVTLMGSHIDIETGNLVYLSATNVQNALEEIDFALDFLQTEIEEGVKERPVKIIPNTTSYTPIAEDYTTYRLVFTANSGEDINININDNVITNSRQYLDIQSAGDHKLFFVAGTGVNLYPTPGNVLNTVGRESVVTIRPGIDLQNLGVFGTLEYDMIDENHGYLDVDPSGGTVTIPHGLEFEPSYVNFIFSSTGFELDQYTFTVDDTNITITFNTTPTTSSVRVYWEAKS